MWYGQPMKWLRGTDDSTAWGILPKNGSTALRHALTRDYGGWEVVDPTRFSNRIFVVRHPIERFESLWLNKCRDARHRGKGPVAECSGKSAEELFQFIQVKENLHWNPQVPMLGNMRSGTEIVRLEDLSSRYEAVSGAPYPLVNVSPDRDDVRLTDALTERLLEYYREDLELWTNRQ